MDRNDILKKRSGCSVEVLKGFMLLINFSVFLLKMKLKTFYSYLCVSPCILRGSLCNLKNAKFTNMNHASLVFAFIVVIVGFSQFPLTAQNTKTLSESYIEKYNHHISDAALLNQLNKLPAEEVIEAFIPFTKDSISTIRSEARQQIAKAGFRSDKPKTRHSALEIVMQGLDDKDVGTIGLAVNLLTQFRPADFDAEDRYILSQKIKPGTPYLEKIILLTGYVKIPDLIYNYRQMLLEKEKYNSRIRLNMQLALARMGDTTAIQSVVNRIKRITISDNMVYEVYPLLAYTRQKEVFGLLLETIMSDSKDCHSSNPDKETPIICAFRVIEMVAPYIIDFPVKVDASGEIIFENYSKTLDEVRAWIAVHKTDYTLNDEKY